MIHHDQRDKAVAERETGEWFAQRHADKIAAGKRASAETLRRIEETGNLLADFIVPLNGPGRFRYADGPNQVLLHHANGESHTFTLHPHAAQQAADKLGVPGPYLRRLAEGQNWERGLAANILQEHAEHGPRERVLVRSVNGQARGILSTNYKRLDSALVLGAFLEAARTNGAEIYKAWADDTRFSVEAVIPQVFPIQTVSNGLEYVSVGLMYSTSDFGDGADKVQGWLERVRCTNKAVAGQALRQVHLGRKLPDDMEWSRQTYRAESIAHASAVRDVVAKVLETDTVRGRFLALSEAAADKLDLKDEVVRLSKAGLGKGEIEQVEKVLAEGDPDVIPVGALTRWKLSQAVSAVAQTSATIRRRADLEELAGVLVFGKEKANGSQN